MTEQKRPLFPNHAQDVYAAETIAGFKAAGLWRDQTLTDHLDRHVVERADAVAVIDADRSVTWAELAGTVDRIASGLRATGLESGDVVAIQLPNVIEFVECYLAAHRAGLRALALLPTYASKDVTHMLGRCQARAYIVSRSYRGMDGLALARAAEASASAPEFVLLRGAPAPSMPSLESLRGHAPLSGPELAALRPDPDSLSKVSFTSGSTGTPKGVVHTHNTDLVTPTMVIDALGLGPQTPVWMPSPLAHTTGILFGMHVAVLAGAPLVLQDQWNPATGARLIEQHRVTYTIGATPFITELLDDPAAQDRDLSSLQFFLSGGAVVPPSLVERSAVQGIELLRVFGATEAPLHTINFPGDPVAKKVGRDGRPFEGVEVRVVDPNDRTVTLEVGEVGEYATRGPHVFLGYLDDPVGTSASRDDAGWYYSGDLCSIDEDGYVLFVGRIKDIINRGGHKISALEVENLLLTSEAVHSAAVVAVPDDRLGERVCAFVVPEAEAEVTLALVQEHLRSLDVTKHKWPERIEVVSSLPMTSTGKVDKPALVEDARDRRSGA